MLCDADRALIARETDLPALATVLDPERLQSWLGDRLGVEIHAQIRYLRYKPGTSCVAAVQVSGPSTCRTMVVTAYASGGFRKLAKSVNRAPAGALLAMDPSLSALVAAPAADRDLPALRLLSDDRLRPMLLRRVWGQHAQVEGTSLRELAYKPQRRWVGRLEMASGPVLVRAYRRGDLEAAAARIQALAGAPARTPRLLGTDRRRGFAAVEFLPGDAVPAVPDRASLAAAGRVLDTLHGHPANLPRHDARTDRAALNAVVRQLGIVLPEIGEEVVDVAHRTADELREDVPSVSLHGDLSLDQVIIDGGEAGLIDLDHACTGPAEADLASLLADAHVRGAGDVTDLFGGVVAGYRRPLDTDRLATYTALQLLRRAAEPFRRREEEWPERTRRVVDSAARVLRGGITALEAAK
ncbi:phosphotransferase enzyme family protein [Ruania alba]|uniref:Ser/Thr protein kinase RdoA involved in Cpx stress response, MazF antagonist n=1 Tax=Ruania alba TaxID=648782 RepID=A0A1H5N1U5_9MICO|nr:phosphotransferase [Ruania alba]SEE95486.1 Ser/Thr protein kinase RdoA involved in Cpx stress response, MazF antagonist [Ruania alba]